MILSVPQVLQLNPPGYGGDPNRMIDIELDFPGFAGLGDLGQTCEEDPSLCTAPVPVTPAPPLDITDLPLGSMNQLPPITINEVGGGASGGGGSSWSPAQLAQLFGVAGSTAATAIMAGNAPPGYMYNPNTGRYQLAGYGAPMVGAGTVVSAGISGSMIPVILGIIGIGIVAFAVSR